MSAPESVRQPTKADGLDYEQAGMREAMSRAVGALNDAQCLIDRPEYVPHRHFAWLLHDIENVEKRIADIRRRMEARYGQDN